MWQYEKEVEIPTAVIAKRIYENAIKYFTENYSTHWVNEDYVKKTFIPLWEKNLEVFGLVVQNNFPIISVREDSKYKVIKSFSGEWEEILHGEIDENKFTVIKNEPKKIKYATAVKSFWRAMKHDQLLRIAFVFDGIFWEYRYEAEKLEEAVERFLDKHFKYKKYFEDISEIKYKKYLDNEMAVRILFENGAILFNKNQIAFTNEKIEEYTATEVWKILFMFGYDMNLKRMDFVKEDMFNEYYYRNVLTQQGN